MTTARLEHVTGIEMMMAILSERADGERLPRWIRLLVMGNILFLIANIGGGLNILRVLDSHDAEIQQLRSSLEKNSEVLSEITGIVEDIHRAESKSDVPKMPGENEQSFIERMTAFALDRIPKL